MGLIIMQPPPEPAEFPWKVILLSVNELPKRLVEIYIAPNLI